MVLLCVPHYQPSLLSQLVPTTQALWLAPTSGVCRHLGMLNQCIKAQVSGSDHYYSLSPTSWSWKSSLNISTQTFASTTIETTKEGSILDVTTTGAHLVAPSPTQASTGQVVHDPMSFSVMDLPTTDLTL